MKISQIMRTNISDERLPHQLPGSLSLSELKPSAIHASTVYEVAGEDGAKIGEVRGRDLLYLMQAMQELDLEDIINMFDDGLVVIDASGKICFENEAYSRIIGVPMRKTIGRDMHVIEPDALLLQVLDSGRPIQKERHLIRSVNRYVSARMQPIYKNGEVIGAMSLFHDVTELDELGRDIKRLTGIARQFESHYSAKEEIDRKQIICRSKSFKKIMDEAETVALTDATVLIRGENGVGKEIVAKFIHRSSNRKNNPFITVNCAAIPENLIESELFGYEEGSFTGAKKGGKVGKFELAHGGTLFLDEIGDMPLSMQAKLLRVLQEGEIEKLGREKNIPVDVRIIAATNQPLEELMKEKKFRPDLFFRIQVVELVVPPLRERRDDILPLANLFLETYNKTYGKHVLFSAKVYQQLEHYSWPGNVRQLQHKIESVVIMANVPEVESIDLQHSDLSDSSVEEEPSEEYRPVGTLQEEVALFEQRLIQRVIRSCDGNREKAARQLGISRRTLYRKL